MKKPNLNTVPSQAVVQPTVVIADAAANEGDSMTGNESNPLPELAAEANAAHAAYEASQKSSVEQRIIAGKRLLEAKAKCKSRGDKFMPWVKANCKFSGRTARYYMTYAKKSLEMATVANLTLKGASRKVGRRKKGERKKEEFYATWANFTEEQQTDFLKYHWHVIKSLVEQIETSGDVADDDPGHLLDQPESSMGQAVN